jgi:hypothetical protein
LYQHGNLLQRRADQVSTLAKLRNRILRDDACFVAGLCNLALVGTERLDRALQFPMFNAQASGGFDYGVDDAANVDAANCNFTATLGKSINRLAALGRYGLRFHSADPPSLLN